MIEPTQNPTPDSDIKQMESTEVSGAPTKNAAPVKLMEEVTETSSIIEEEVEHGFFGKLKNFFSCETIEEEDDGVDQSVSLGPVTSMGDILHHWAQMLRDANDPEPAA